MKNERPLTLQDLDDLKYWRNLEVLTIQAAALLWAGLSPIRYKSVGELPDNIHFDQITYANISLLNILAGLVDQTLIANEFYLIMGDYSSPEKQSKALFSSNDIDAFKTTVKRDVLIAWARNKDFPALRAQLIREQKQAAEQGQSVIIDSPAQFTTSPALQIEYKPYKPKYPNPELETAIEISQEIYDTVPAGERPIKEDFTKERINELLLEKGQTPCRTQIERIDTLARPLNFKSHAKKGVDPLPLPPAKTPAKPSK